jgi:hypothetical protein
MIQRYVVVEGKKGEGCLVEDDVIGNLMAYGGLWEYFSAESEAFSSSSAIKLSSYSSNMLVKEKSRTLMQNKLVNARSALRRSTAAALTPLR